LWSCRAPEDILAFSTDAVNHVVKAYCPIVQKHMNDPFTEEQKAWQQIRRGRWAWRGLGAHEKLTHMAVVYFIAPAAAALAAACCLVP